MRTAVEAMPRCRHKEAAPMGWFDNSKSEDEYALHEDCPTYRMSICCFVIGHGCMTVRPTTQNMHKICPFIYGGGLFGAGISVYP